ncbi:MAG: nucleoside triphosphate pyrophosphohydrolase [Chloroflexota bacterium]|nr:nucleoside triphosphate pyrophosphohydrolase [Chloroflexota bacterium]
MIPSITIVGLGPGQLSDLTVQAHTLFAEAAANGQTVYFRTLIHPMVGPLQEQMPSLHIESFDHFYEESSNWETLYQQIAERVCTLASQEPIIYGVPGHPLIGELSVLNVLKLARERGLTSRIVSGLSFLEPVCSTLELDPFEAGTQIIDATLLAALDLTEVAGKIIPTIPLLVGQVYNRRIATAVKLALSECYPDDWPVKLVKAAGVDANEAIETVTEMPLYALDRNSLANHLCTLYVPPLNELQAVRLAETLRYITMRLRRDPDGCPWDRQQTHQTLMRYVLEEAYEVVESLEENSMPKLADELGDLLLQVYLHAEIARQEGVFAIGDVFEAVNTKLVRRHPHVFGSVEVNSADQVLQNWAVIKKQERIEAGTAHERKYTLDGVPQALPALMISQEYKKRVAKLGFEFETMQDMFKKIQEELQEVQEAETPEQQLEELGDVLFIVSQIANWLHVDAEEALRRANRKFRQRFQNMEEIIEQEGTTLPLAPEQWDALWQRVK